MSATAKYLTLVIDVTCLTPSSGAEYGESLSFHDESDEYDERAFVYYIIRY